MSHQPTIPCLILWFAERASVDLETFGMNLFCCCRKTRPKSLKWSSKFSIIILFPRISSQRQAQNLHSTVHTLTCPQLCLPIPWAYVWYSLVLMSLVECSPINVPIFSINSNPHALHDNADHEAAHWPRTWRQCWKAKWIRTSLPAWSFPPVSSFWQMTAFWYGLDPTCYSWCFPEKNKKSKFSHLTPSSVILYS